jgi:23S rRNA pseudouridine1911/1915/1917 synthase
MAHLRHPVFGDPQYGGRLRLPAGASEALKQVMRGFKRQALHAKRLAFVHPIERRSMRFECALPADMRMVIDALARDANVHWQEQEYDDFAGFEDLDGYADGRD